MYILEQYGFNDDDIPEPLTYYDTYRAAAEICDLLNNADNFNSDGEPKYRVVELPKNKITHKTPLIFSVMANYNREAEEWQVHTCYMEFGKQGVEYTEEFHVTVLPRYKTHEPKFSAVLRIRAKSATAAQRRMLDRCKRVDMDKALREAEDLERMTQII